MPKFTIKNKIVVVVLLFGSAWGLYALSIGQTRPLSPERSDGGQGKFSVENFRGESENVLPETSVLEINGTRYEGEVEKGESVYDFMNSLRAERKINFTEKNYTGMGKFIDSLGGISGNRKETWIYYVNGKKASVGVSNYKINPGDIVSWKYEKNI